MPRTAASATFPSDPLWYRNAVIYQLHVRAFHDSDGDGIGDFRGLTEKLDYLQDLGVTALWLLPFYPSPLRDDGYDTADYMDIHPDYGTLRDFRRFIGEARKRGLRVITELVLNHTSDQHPWFQRACRAPAGSPHRQFYVWHDSDEKYSRARIIFKDFETSNWTWDPVARAYYWHRFYSHQPDLNFDNPAVHEALLKVLDFWFEMGVDGLRLDAVPYLYEREDTTCENLPETHAFLKKLRRHVDEKFADRMLLAEANQWPEDAIAYFGDGDECHMAFHFPLMPRLFMSLRMEDRFPIIDILQQTPEIPAVCQWALFLRNHDELTLEMVTDEERDYMYRVYAHDRQARINLGIRRRLAPLLSDDRRKIELLNGLLFSLPGTPVIYYGDELGMGDNVYLGDRNGVRTPMQWSADRNGGFSAANPQKLYLPVITDPEYHFQTVNVEAQHNNPSSMLWWIKRLIALRHRYPVFGSGSIEFLHPGTARILAFVRENAEQTVLVVANLSRFIQHVELELGRYRDRIPVELFGMSRLPPIHDTPYVLTLGPHAFYWFSLEGHPAEPPESPDRTPELPTIAVSDGWEQLFRGRGKSALEALLPRIISPRRWFGGKARMIDSAKITDAVAFPGGAAEPLAYFVIAEVSYVEGEPETYQIPLAFLPDERGEALIRQVPHAAFARVRVRGPDASGVLCDAVHDRGFCLALLAAMRRRRKAPTGTGELLMHSTAALRGLADAECDTLEPSVARAEQSNSSVIFGNRFILKLFRKLADGENPDLEMSRFLTERARFAHTPAIAGWIEQRPRRGEPRTLGMMQTFMPNEGDAWEYTMAALSQYFEQGLTERGDLVQPILPGTLLDTARHVGQGGAGIGPLTSGQALTREAQHEHPIGPYLQSVELLGKRTAEMHLALASDFDDPDFAPEAFTPHQNRSTYQSMRNLTRRTIRLLHDRMPELAAIDETLAEQAQSIIDDEPGILAVFYGILEFGLGGQRIRTHGDYHLGQVLNSGRDFLIIDFEGEPARPLGERRMKRSPLRDVAGMLRSFDYAACTALHQHRERFGISKQDELIRLHDQADCWRSWVAAVFLRHYLDRIGPSGLLPTSEEQLAMMLDSFVLEKAIYELQYELNNRPDWIGVPIDGIRRLRAGAAT